MELLCRVSRLNPPNLIEETVGGVYVSPPDAESLRLVFDHSGRLVHYREIPVELVLNAIPDTAHYLAFPNFCKTISAPSHVAICLLLQTLKKKFVKNLKVHDDTKFWKTWDLDQLYEGHAVMGAITSAFS